MIEINLLPRRLVQRKQVRAFVGFVSICAVIAVAISALLWYMVAQELAHANRELQNTRNRVSRFQPQLREISEYQDEISAVEDRLQAIRGLSVGQSVWAGILRDVQRAVPEGVWLTGIEELEAGSRKFVNIEGLSLMQALAVAQFMENLSRSPLLENARFYDLTQRNLPEYKAMRFRISCQVTPSVST